MKQWFAHLWDVSCTFHIKIEPLHIWWRHVCTLAVDVYFTDLHIWGRRVCTNVVVCTFEGKMFAQMWLFAHLRVKCFAQMWLFAHLRVKCLHKCGWFLMKTTICTFVGCFTFHVKIEPLHIWRRHVCTLAVDVFFFYRFAHLRVPCLHKCGCLHIWG